MFCILNSGRWNAKTTFNTMKGFTGYAQFFVLCFILSVAIAGCQSSDKEARQNTTDEQPTLSQAKSPQISLNQAWELSEDIKRPESAVYEQAEGVVYISNMDGGATEKNGTGYISKISTDGEMITARWSEGLNAPKGLAISGDYLYASDIDELVKINLESGEIAATYEAENAEFLNDVTADADGNVYVSDSRDKTVYRHRGDTFEVWLESDQIKSPNGLYAEKGRLVIAACGIESENPGSNRYLQAISYESKAVTPLGKEEPIGGLDAVQPNGQGGYFLTDWSAGKVFTYNTTDGATLLREISKGTADLDYLEDQKLLVIPIMMSDQVLAFEVK